MKKLRRVEVIYADETEIKVDGKTYHLWVFITNKITVFVIRKSRGENVIQEVLGKHFKFTIVCDGWKVYVSYTKNVQRCWAHLLREAEALAKKHLSGESLFDGLRRIFIQVRAITKNTEEKLRIKIHNNLAEQKLREPIVQRKIFGTLRNEKGTKIMEILLSLITTWKNNQLNPHLEIAAAL